MAYQNISFPALKLVHDIQLERIVPTVIVSNYAKEYRINRYAGFKRRYTYPGRNVAYADYLTLINFIVTVNGKQDSFNFTSPIVGVGTQPTVVKVRFDSIPTFILKAIDSQGYGKIMEVGAFSLIQVYNE
jgi:FAD synthase